VGISVRVMVVDVAPDGKSKPLALINPRIDAHKGQIKSEEGCLSFPGIQVTVPRWAWVKVSAINEKGLPVSIEADGLLSRCLQHEMDHLDGVVMIDRLSLPQRVKALWEIRKRKKAGLGRLLKTVFFGTPAVAVPFLERLAQRSRVIGVVTSPDRPAGRGYAVTPTEVKRAAHALALPVQQPESLAGFRMDSVFGQTPDVGVVVAYGHLIPSPVFNEPQHGLINVHFSLVPQYRGAAPMQWALIQGETETGVSLFQIEKGWTRGPSICRGPPRFCPTTTWSL
jgi:hypothetical protein